MSASSSISKTSPSAAFTISFIDITISIVGD
jgi:hypothetical protein